MVSELEDFGVPSAAPAACPAPAGSLWDRFRSMCTGTFQSNYEKKIKIFLNL